jgi:NTE family protein
MLDSRGEYKIGLALGGGAARGWSHIGVLRTLAKAGIHPDIIVGTSIGAVVGGCYVAGELDELETFARSLTRRKVLGFLDFNFTGAGLINGDRLCNQLDTKLQGRTIEGLPRKFAAVATEMGSGHEVWLSRGSLSDAMRASYALPGIFKPVERDGRWLFDGAMVNPVPVSVARALGARYVIAVNLNADMAERGTMAPIRDTDLPDAPVLCLAEPDTGEDDAAGNMIVRNGRALKKLLQRQIFGAPNTAPGMSTVMMEAFNIVQDRIARSRLAGDPPDVMIAPRTGAFSLFDFHRAEELIAAGETAAHRVLDDIAREIAIRRAPRATRPAAGASRASAITAS